LEAQMTADGPHNPGARSAAAVALTAAEQAAIVAAGLDAAAVTALCQRARAEVDEGLLPAVQIALARNGHLVIERRFGAVSDDGLVCVFSATKALTASVVWLLLEEGALALTDPVVRYIPEFDTHGKDAVQVLHLLTHTAGFPHAPFRPLDWNDPARRAARYAQWRLNWAPGSAYEYHPSSSMWVLAELIERVCSKPFCTVVRERVLTPLGLDGLWLGDLPEPVQNRVVPVAIVGEAATAADYQAAGVPVPPETEVTDDALLNFNDPAIRDVGVPGGGAVASAAGLALLHQALWRGEAHGTRLWQEETLARARAMPFPEHRDPYLGCAANRGLGLIIAGDKDRTLRGFGHGNSPDAFGHNGAGGQLAWVDPATGLSLGYVTSGHDRNSLRQARRGVAISSLAAETVR
jgi:CubicO group peptidase (beta-lactamase class C family)